MKDVVEANLLAATAQIDARGCDGMDLLRWLRSVVFPAESLWRDPGFAARQTIDAYRRLLRAGTLGYGGYLTSHAHGVAAVIQAGDAVPLRSVVGQVLMDRNAPDELIGQAIAQPPHAAGDQMYAETSVVHRIELVRVVHDLPDGGDPVFA